MVQKIVFILFILTQICIFEATAKVISQDDSLKKEDFSKKLDETSDSLDAKFKKKKIQVPEKTPEPTLEQTLIQSNIEISEGIDRFAEKIDLYLIGKKITSDKNETRIFIESQATTVEEQEPDYNTNIGGELKLPNFEKHWQLKFSSRDKSEERAEGPRYLQKNKPQKKVAASVGFLRDFGSTRANYQPKISLQALPQISHSLTFENEGKYKDLEISHELELFADANLGTGIGHSIDFSLPISKFKTIRQTNGGRYIDKTHEYSLTNSLALIQSLNKTMTFSYNGFVSGRNREVQHITQYGISSSFNHVLYKKILDYTLTPHLTFSEDKNFRGLLGFTLATTLNF